MRVFVYWNIPKGCWSVKALEGESKGMVILHAPDVRLDNARFNVQEGGRNRVLKEGQKNVHAGVVGDLVSAMVSDEILGDMLDEVPDLNNPPPLVSAPYLSPVHYVPAIGPYFFWVNTMEPVAEAPVVLMEHDKRVLAAYQRG